MKNRICLFLLPFFLLAFLLFPMTASAQLSLTTSGTTVTIDFDNTVSGVNEGSFEGTGFQPSPGAGQLNSNAWAMTGWSDGSLAFGGTQVSGDFARGSTNVPVTTGGVYALNDGGNRRFLIQPAGGDWTPGTLTLRIQNNTGAPLRQIDVAYDLFIRNDGNRANSFNFSYSTDDVTYTPVPSMDYTSPATATNTFFLVGGTSPSRRVRIAGLDIPNGGFFYVRWSGNDVSGTGARDEFVLDNIAVTGFTSSIIAGGTYPNLLIVGDPSGDRPALAANITPDSLAILPNGALDGLDRQILGTGFITIRGRFVTQRSGGLSGNPNAAFPSASFTLDSTSTIRYERPSGSQTVTGRNDYGNVEIAGTSSKTLSGNTLIRGSLVLVASTLDVGNHTLTFRSGNTPIVRNGVTQTGTISFGTSATLQFGDATSQLGAAFTIPDDCFLSPPFIQNLSINRINPITLGNQDISTNTLTLTNGIFIVANGGSPPGTGIIIVSSNAPTAITGGSSSSHIRGTLRRVLQSNVSADGVSYFFPIADASGAYRPATLLNIRTGSGTCSMQITAGTTGATTFDATLISIRPPYWLIEETDLPGGDFIRSTLELTGTSLIDGENRIGASNNTVSGTYTSIGGTVSGSTITSNAQALTLLPSYQRYVAIGAFSPEPTVQASGISFSSVTANSFTINWTSGNGTNRLVVMRRDNPVTFTPVDGTNYTGINSVFSFASNQDADNNRIVFAGTGSSVNVTGLSGNTTYHVAIYEFNGTLSNNSANFLITAPATGSQTTIPNQPTQNTNQLTFSNFQTNALTLSWNVPSGDVGENRLVVVRQGASPDPPTDLVGYTANPNFGSGDQTGPGSFVVYNGNSPNTVTVTGLSPETQYFFSIFEYNGSGATANYNPSGANANRWTLKNEPNGVSALSISSITKTSLTLSWNLVSTAPDSVIIFRRSGISVPFEPADGRGYEVSELDPTTGWRVVAKLVGTATTFNVSGLSSGTTHYFRIFAFNQNPASTQTANYRTSSEFVEGSATTLSGTIYDWIADNDSWTIASNWSPAGGPPTDGDLARFNSVGSITVSNVPTTSIGGIEINGESKVTFTTAGARTVTLTGFGSGTGNALNVNSGQLTLGGSNPCTLSIQSGNTGRIAGSLQFIGAAHRLFSRDSASVIFENGSEMIAASGFTGNAFGTTNLNSVVFQNGSIYRAQSGANPFGAPAPNSVVIFQSGSTYSQEVNSTPSISGRTYANFEVNLSTFNQTINGGGSPFTVDSIIVNSSTSIIINNAGGIVLRGNLVAGSGTTTIGSTNTPVTFGGTSTQQIRGTATLTFGTNASVTLNNPNGLVLNRPVTLQNTLTLTNGLLTTNHNLTLSSTASVSGGNDNSYIVGSLAQEYNTTPTARLYPFGSFGRYRPISVLGNTSSGTGILRGQLFDSDANLRESIIDPPNRVSLVRYYGFQLTGNAVTVDQIPVLRANVDDGIGSFLSNATLRIATARTGTGWTLRNLASPPNTTSLPVNLSSETGLSFTINPAPDSALFALGSTSNTDNPLPVELLAYTGTSTSDGAVLTWQTASEVDNLGFTILKDGVEIASFTNTPSLRGRGTTQEETHYQFIDSNVKVGDVHQYALHQTDLNGTVHELGTVTLHITTAVAPREYSLSQNYPNPFNPTTTITYTLKASGEVKLELFDVLGRKVATLVNARQDAGSYTYILNASRYGLATGMYFYRLQSGGFVATKKMLFVK